MPQDYIDGIWPSVEHLILRACRRVDRNIPVSLRDELRSGDRQLWLVTEDDVTILAAVVTAIDAKRSGLVLKIEYLGGDSMQRWVHFMVDQLEAYGRSQGCTKLAWEGRKGWKRLFPDYRISGVVMEKRLDADA